MFKLLFLTFFRDKGVIVFFVLELICFCGFFSLSIVEDYFDKLFFLVPILMSLYLCVQSPITLFLSNCYDGIYVNKKDCLFEILMTQYFINLCFMFITSPILFLFRDFIFSFLILIFVIGVLPISLMISVLYSKRRYTQERNPDVKLNFIYSLFFVIVFIIFFVSKTLNSYKLNIFLIFIGVIFLINTKRLIKVLNKKFTDKRYEFMQGFRGQ